ncbi:hypothetical protein QFC19_001653 [Naganishia cerealis]|uniref:Uncharacterized protein n=1 Tax=Naganishia cerealis TaxID=610337 RepID=A0ACC2WGG9_9TREE|nr:hypothetical protein QFC19_001653 [Naganishia cerealis]
MPSVRVRRNTATAAALVPPERLQNLSTNPHGCSQQEETTPEQRSDGSSDADKDMKDGGVVILAPPISTGETTDGLMSYFGLGDGVEAKLQSWEDTRRDLEKGLPYGGKAVRAVGELTPTSEASEEAWEDEQHDDEVVEHLDVIDPQIGAVSHLQNFANSVMIPYFPELYSRKPMLDLPTPATSRPSAGQPAPSATNTSGLRLRKPTLSTQQPEPSAETVSTPDKFQIKPAHKDSDTIESSEEDALDQHVKDVLHKSKREWLKRSLKGVWTFLKTPMGIITGIYGFLVVFWGAALVLFLVGKA